MANAVAAHGATVTFATSSFTFDIVDIEWSGIDRAEIDVSHQGSTDWMEYIPDGLTDPGELTLTGNFDPDMTPPDTGVPETITVNWPAKSGQGTPAKWEATGFLTASNVTHTRGEKAEYSCTFKMDGQITRTAGAP